jgi:spermidine synthase
MSRGSLVYCERDEYGPIEVRDEGDKRFLYLGSNTVQSAMFLHDPYALALAYTQNMLALLPLIPSPTRTLIIGLGGGSLAKFLLRHFADSYIDAVELRRTIITVAQRYFQLPTSPRLHLHVADALNFVNSARERDAQYDVLFVDAYSAQGPASTTLGDYFIDRCRSLLTPQGVLVLNLWSSDRATFQQQMRALLHIFEDSVWQLKVPDRGNVIAMAGATLGDGSAWRRASARARDLKRQLGLDFPEYLSRMETTKRSRWQALIDGLGLASTPQHKRR